MYSQSTPADDRRCCPAQFTPTEFCPAQFLPAEFCPALYCPALSCPAPILLRSTTFHSQAVSSAVATDAAVSLNFDFLTSRAILVVCPVTPMGQWAEELAAKTGGRLKVLTHYGPKRSTNPMELLDYDVVLTTYQMILMELDFIWDLDNAAARGQRHPCCRIKWHRLVLDEAHTAKNPKSGWTRVCDKLASDNR